MLGRRRHLEFVYTVVYTAAAVLTSSQACFHESQLLACYHGK